jgi:hypothetical protein
VSACRSARILRKAETRRVRHISINATGSLDNMRQMLRRARQGARQHQPQVSRIASQISYMTDGNKSHLLFTRGSSADHWFCQWHL